MRQSDFDSHSNPSGDPAPTLTRGTALGRFVVLGLVGRGGMGEVYAAYDPDLDRKVAIKLLRARAGDSTDNRSRLVREAKAAAKVSHPNVVVVYDTGTFGDRVFIAMEFVEGHTLRYWLHAQDRTWQEVLDAFIAAGRGLAAAHDKELVHRDFKPDNVMVTTQGNQVRVMDFGLARVVATGQPRALVDLDATIDLREDPEAPPVGPEESRELFTSTGAVLGTPAYMSPEQFRSQPADARSDQFSFCVALHEALYGDRPFAGQSLEELADNVVAGRLSEPGGSKRVPIALRKILGRGLSPRPEERFPSMTALVDELALNSGAGRAGFARGAAAKLEGVWEAPAGGRPFETLEKETMRQAFLATGKPYAATAFVTASAVLDRYAQRWTDLYVEACEATHVRGDQSAEVLDLRMAVLNEGLDDLKALCRIFREATGPVVENAVKAADALGTLERCQDLKLLRALVRPPDDATTRTAVDVLRRRLVEVRAMSRVGRFAASLDAVVPLAQEARRVGYAPMTAEVLLVYGQLQLETARTEAAARTFEEAFFTAERSRHDEVAADAAIHLIFLMGYLQSRFEVGELWARYAEALLERLGGHDYLWGFYFDTRANMREQEGRLDESVEDSRRALAALERALGPNTPELGRSISNLANHLAYGGDFAAALEASGRALEIATARLGREHPSTALILANWGQYNYRLSRYGEARAAAAEALAVFERETNPDGYIVTLPLRTLGLCHLAEGRPADARPLLERAVAIREARYQTALRLAEVHFPLARALFARRSDRERALELGRRARDEYLQGALPPLAKRDLADLDAWLAASAQEARRTGKAAGAAARARRKGRR
jgi:tRNA A-37 threonylcarbamoyl transferase component Bud32/Tfp pilus assembly protein PilF